MFGSGQIQSSSFSSYTPLLDSYPALFAFSSARKLRSGETIIETDRRYIDSTQQSFTSIEKTDGTLATFSQGSEVATVTPKDQSGNGLIATQAAAASQPLCVDGSGNVIITGGHPSYDSSGKGGWETGTPLNLSAHSEVWFFFVANYQAAGTAQTLFENSNYLTSSPQVDGVINCVVNSSNEFVFNQRIDSATPTRFRSSAPTGQTLVSARFRVGEVGGAAFEVYFNGVQQTNTESSTETSVAFRDYNMNFLQREGVLNVWESNLQEIIIMSGDQSANRLDIEADIKTFYGL